MGRATFTSGVYLAWSTVKNYFLFCFFPVGVHYFFETVIIDATCVFNKEMLRDGC